MVPDADLRIKLPVFEGPLDLLLFLIRKNELDIYDIPIATVTKQYIEVLRSMRELDLDIAGEFFVMAASLMEIKSRMLLPRGQAAIGESADDDPLDPRWELVHQLLQYKKFKEAAAKLDELASFQRDMLARQVVEVAVTENERPLKPVDRIELWNAFNIVLRRLAEKFVVGEIKGEEVTVSDKMEELLHLVETRKNFLFTDLFEGQPVTVRVLVATFIAVLELTRLKKLRVRQAEAYADIYVEAVENTVNPDGSLAEGQLNFTPAEPEQTHPAVATPPAEEETPPNLDGEPLAYAVLPTLVGSEPEASPGPVPEVDQSATTASPAHPQPMAAVPLPEAESVSDEPLPPALAAIDGHSGQVLPEPPADAASALETPAPVESAPPPASPSEITADSPSEPAGNPLEKPLETENEQRTVNL